MIFIPTILSLQPSFNSFENLIGGFFAFSFVASAFYILNDLFDIENDRAHTSKKNRSFASGYLSITHGFFIFVLLVSIALFMSIKLPQTFQMLLFLYAATTFIYSKYLKKIPILDIMTLSSLYLLRIVSGGALVGVYISNWLLTFQFSSFYF